MKLGTHCWCHSAPAPNHSIWPTSVPCQHHYDAAAWTGLAWGDTGHYSMKKLKRILSRIQFWEGSTIIGLEPTHLLHMCWKVVTTPQMRLGNSHVEDHCSSPSLRRVQKDWSTELFSMILVLHPDCKDLAFIFILLVHMSLMVHGFVPLLL